MSKKKSKSIDNPPPVNLPPPPGQKPGGGPVNATKLPRDHAAETKRAHDLAVGDVE